MNDRKVEPMLLEARAKINLTLDVTGVRSDGYHLVRMIMQSVTLHDTIRMEKRDVPGILLRTDSEAIPGDQGNLMWKAADLMIRRFHLDSGIEMDLQKRIPAAAGLAGGSTDAAAVFKGMNELFGLGLEKEELMRLALPLGADIPYCILGGTALAEGIGEQLTVLTPLPDCRILIARPDLEVSTGWVYRKLDETPVLRHPDTEQMLKALREGDLAKLAGGMENVLEQVTAAAWPVITEIRNCMLEMGALGARMSGSGSAVFGLFDSKAAAEAAGEEIRKRALAEQVLLTEPCM